MTIRSGLRYRRLVHRLDALAHHRARVPKTTLRAIKDRLRKMPDHGIGYSALKYASAPGDEVPACLRRHRLPAISFNYLGAFNEQADDALWALIDQTADLKMARCRSAATYWIWCFMFTTIG